MLHLVLGCVLALQQPQMIMEIRLPEPNGAEPELMMWVPKGKLEIPKLSPKQKWPFDWLVSGLVRDARQPGDFRPRFRVYAQHRREGDELNGEAARTLLRLWQMNRDKLRLDHSDAYQRRMVDVYLCEGGTAGGEQLFAVDTVGNDSVKVNTIYLYQVGSLTNRLERVRELAHEYGHAVLPPYGTFSGPEDWASGDIGERIYLKWLREGLVSKRLSIYDTMGATLAQLDSYLASKVRPLVLRTAKNGPSFAALKKMDASGFDALVALAVYVEQILPPRAFGRSLTISGSTSATDYIQSAIEAAAEVPKLTIRAPSGSGLTEVWVPLGKGRTSGKISARQSGWAKVGLSNGAVTIMNPQQ